MDVAGKKWWLVSAEQRSAEYPTSFWIPKRALREALKRGDIAKLVFEMAPLPNGCNGERMWVKIERVLRDADTGKVHYSGHLMSKPAFMSIAVGETIDFGPEHIAEVD